VGDSRVNKGSGHIDILCERLLSALFGCGSAALRYRLFEIRDQKADTRIPRSPGTHTHGLIQVCPFAFPVGSSQGRAFIGNFDYG